MTRLNIKKQNKSLADIESAIIALVGEDIDSYNLHLLSSEEIETIEDLLADRKHILNEMFQPTDKNMARFRAINQRLYELTENLHCRFKIIESKSAIFSDCPDFDDDYEIEGWLRHVFNGTESLLVLPDDEYYGSRFIIMIKTLYELYEEKGLHNIESVYHESTSLDDGISWNEPPYRGKPEFDDIVICHAVHDLTNHKAYSIPDLLRLNDFWCEVQIKIQSITDQKGNRWTHEECPNVKTTIDNNHGKYRF